MLDISWGELAIVGVIALIVIGPKELPSLLRTIGRFTARARSLAAEFRSGLDDIARETELDEFRRSIRKAAVDDIESEFRSVRDEAEAAFDIDDHLEEAERRAARKARETPVESAPPAAEPQASPGVQSAPPTVDPEPERKA